MDLSTLLSLLEDTKDSNVDDLMKTSKELLELAKEKDNHFYLAKANYYTAWAYWRKGSIEKSMKYALETMKYINAHEDPAIYAKTNNILGIICCLDQNDMLAMEHYLEGMEYAQLYHLDTLTSSFMVNIGSLYQNLGQHEKAIEYFQEAQKLVMLVDDKCEDYYRRYVNTSLNFAISYLHLEEYGLAEDYIMRVLEASDHLATHDLNFIIYCIYCRIKVRQNQPEEARKELKHLFDLFSDAEEEVDYAQDVGEFYQLLLEMGEYEKLNRVISVFEIYVEQQNCKQLCLQALDMRLKYYKQIGNLELYGEKCREYYELNVELMTENNEKRVRSLETKLALQKNEKTVKESERERAQLKKKSEEDPLTRMGNRYRLESYFKRLIKENAEAVKQLTVGIIDVDFFKEYNDFYGHVQGDECLRQVAKVISKYVEPEFGICARFGGDEFVLLMPQVAEQDVRQVAEQIMNEIRGLNIPHERSCISPVITVSQGYYMGSTKQQSILSDFIEHADRSLYRVKKCSRDNYEITT